MKHLASLAVFGVLLMGATPSPGPQPAIISQSFADRAARLEARIADDGSRHLFAPGQEPLMRVQLAEAKRANDAHASDAAAMLDAIDRQLAAVDFTLSRAEDGSAIVVHVGDEVTVAMHDPYLWRVQVSDPSALVLHRGVMWMRGVQGAFSAQKPSTVTLTLTANTPGASPAPPTTLKQPVVFTVVILPKN